MWGSTGFGESQHGLHLGWDRWGWEGGGTKNKVSRQDAKGAKNIAEALPLIVGTVGIRRVERRNLWFADYGETKLRTWKWFWIVAVGSPARRKKQGFSLRRQGRKENIAEALPLIVRSVEIRAVERGNLWFADYGETKLRTWKWFWIFAVGAQAIRKKQGFSL